MNFTTLLVTVTMLIMIHPLMAAELEEFYPGERDALIQLRESVKSNAIDLHSRWTGPPCNNNSSNWVGIACSNGHVIHIVLDNLQLTGLLPPTFLQEITYLSKLSFENNILLGPLPILAGLVHLQYVFLSHNLFSTSIPTHYIDLPELTSLQLQQNLLTGGIPPFDQPTLMVFNVSYNSLEGLIPQTPTLQKFSNDSYSHNLELCGKPLNNTCPTPNISPPPAAPPLPSSPSKSTKLSIWTIVLIAVSAVLLPFIVMIAFLCYFRKINVLQGDGEDVSDEEKVQNAMKRDSDPERRVELEFFDKERPMFDLDDLLRASAEMIGKGKMGSTYKVTIDSGPIVVVKRFKEMSDLDKKEFVQQMQLLGEMRHENLVQIVSFYCSKDEKLVVCEFVPNDGSLAELLHEKRGSGGRVALNWSTRLSIVKGVAKGLAYLHESLPSHKVPHGNLKSSNILIRPNSNNNNHQIYLTDFGFLPLLPSRKAASEKLSVGRAPEFSQGKKLTHKADVYCFGIVLLEIITGRQVPPERNGDTTIEDLAQWVRSVITDDWSTDILDAEILAASETHDEMLKLAEIALDCTSVEPEKRPKMNQVLRRIQSIN